ncbi:MAG TPA: ATP-binding protein [Ktedonobacterales bacterium]
MDRMKDILEKLAKQNAAGQAPSDQDIPPTDAKPGTPARTHKTAGSHHASHASKAGGPSRHAPKAPKGAPPTERETGTNSNPMTPAARLHAVPRLVEQVAADVDVLSTRKRPSRVQDMDMDRILELPARRRDAEMQSLPGRVAAAQSGSLPVRVEARRTLTPRSSMSDMGDMGGPGTGSSGLEPIGDSMRGFLERLAERRRRRALSGAPAEASQLASVPKPPICPYCGGAGYLRLDVPVGHPSFGQPVPCKCKERELEERHRLEEERRLLELDRFFSLKPFSEKTFATFNPNAMGASEAYNAARKFAEDPDGAQNRWLVLMGAPGTGKTHLAAAIANHRLAVGSSVFFAVVPDLLDHLRSAFAPSSEVPYNEMFETIREVELLVLDDLGAQNSTAWATEKLFQLINHRYNYRMPTVITTNVQAFQRLDERIASRLSDPTLSRSILIETSSRRPRMSPKTPPRW